MGEYKGVLGGVTSMVAGRFTPWHYSANTDRVKLTDLTIESGRQAMTLASIDWPVLKMSLGEFMPGWEAADDYCVTVRGDRNALLGVHKDSYVVIQNEVVADLADAVVEAVDGASILSAGALFDPGKVVWMLVELPDRHVTYGRDGSEIHKRYILVVTTHDASGALRVIPTDVRVECMNTMSLAVRGRAEYTIRHTTNAMDYVAEAKAGLSMATANWQAMDKWVKAMLDAKLDSADFATSFLPKIVGERPAEEGRSKTMWDAKFDSIMAAYDADHNEAIVGTAWGAVNAVNEYELWGIKPRGREVHEAQFARLLSGQYELTRKAMSLVAN
jgi:phage/plasmid-like protein (TIGR03299 family)